MEFDCCVSTITQMNLFRGLRPGLALFRLGDDLLRIARHRALADTVHKKIQLFQHDSADQNRFAPGSTIALKSLSRPP